MNQRTQGPIRSLLLPAAAILLAVCATGANWAADSPQEQRVQRNPEVGAPVTPFIFDGDVRDLPAVQPWMPGDSITEIPRRFYPKPGHEDQYVSSGVPTVDPLLEFQRTAAVVQGGGSFTTPTRNFPGKTFTGASPPDPVGDVGPNHYIQMVNGGGGADVLIFDKAEPTGNQLASFRLDSLAGGACANGFSDPLVLYDRHANRWLLSEISGSGNIVCVAISQSGDPVSGGWFSYQFTTPTLPDYFKIGVWPTDANGGPGSYIMTANDGSRGSYALDRGAMLSGSAGTFQRFTVAGLPGFSFEALTPADLDGPNLPPSGAPATVMRHRDTESHSGPAAPGDLLEYWSFDVDWINPSNTTLTQETSVDISEIDSNLCGLTSFNCFRQPGTGTQLDPLREVIMFRLQYIRQDDYEALVGNLVTDVDGTDHGGVRWFELRGGAGNWTVHQEGTYSPDADSRFMGAIAMDQSGNIAVAYSVTSSSTFPSLRYTGRLSSDPLGSMTQPETSIHAGTASSGTNRWGDYAAMNLDPADDCTFWFTSLDTTSSTWRTQIASFVFEACGCELEPAPPSAGAAVTGDNEIEISWNDSELATVVEYSVGRSLSPGGPYEPLVTVPDDSPGVGGGLAYTFLDTDVSGGTTYYYIVRSTDGVACTSSESNEASDTATGACTLAPLFEGLQSASSANQAICTVDLSWNAAGERCGGPPTYNIYRSESAGFTPDASNLLISGVNTESFTDTIVLSSDVSYYYVVRAVDQANGAEDANSVELRAIPRGEPGFGTWTDDGGDTGPAQLTAEAPWSLNPSEGNLEPGVYKTGNYGDRTCAELTTPQLQLGSGSVLTFFTKYDIEPSWDKGEVQISTDGSNWQRVPLAYPGNSTQTADECGLPTGTYFTGTDLSWQQFAADLSAWNDQLVQIRFLMSSDTLVTESGWWIDDIAVTHVDGVPGMCEAGNFCLENPFVDLTPVGQSTVCLGEPQLLSAVLSGGTGPFNYQWTRDGVDIPGATEETLLVNDLGTKSYNVKVRADACVDDVVDVTGAQITWVAAPFFDGVQSVTNPEAESCTLDVAWDAATGVCPGPIRYSIYRDTVSPVDTLPENLVASGVDGSSFADSEFLADGEPYFYIVRAVEQSNDVADSNSVEAGAVVTGPGGGGTTLFTANFNGPLAFAGWTVSTGPGPHSCGEWVRSPSDPQRPQGSTGLYPLADSSACGPGGTTSTVLDSPVIDADVPAAAAYILEFDLFYSHGDGDNATVEAWDGFAWQVAWTDPDASTNSRQAIDVTPFAIRNSQFRVRFNYQDAANDGWYAIDNVVLTVSTPCLTVGSGAAPPPVPDGTISGTPLHGSRATLAGDTIDVTWDATSCTATEYNLIYGDLAGVAAALVSGAECAVGTTGAFHWTAVPPGDLFFLMVGSDGGATESSWGTTSALVERNGAGSSAQCAVLVKDVTASCP